MSKMSRTFIHYGSDKFDLNCFKQIKNGWLPNKPYGGLWASPAEAQNGWKTWCYDNDFDTWKLHKSFTFTLSDGAKIFEIKKPSDAKKFISLYGIDDERSDLGFGLIPNIDFEKMKLDYDAIICEIGETDENIGLYYDMYGWDCTSLFVMNPEIICA